MKSREEEPQPELQELLQKPNSQPAIVERKKSSSLIPPSPTDEKSQSGSHEETDEDVVTQAIGEYGRWQLKMTLLLALFSFPCTFHIFLPTFTARETEYWCSRPEHLSSLPVETWIKYSQPDGDPCRVRVLPAGITAESIIKNEAPILNEFEKCQDWEFDKSEAESTIISEWKLVCDRASMTSLVEVLFLMGVAIGGVVGGWISDKFGRKRVLMSMLSAQSALALLSLLIRSYIQYVIIRLVMGLVSVSIVYAAFVLSVELVGGKWVTIAGVCYFFPLPIAYMLVSVISMYLRNWRDLTLAFSLPGCLLLILWFFLPESPRWLISLGKTPEAKVILQEAAKFNKRELPKDFDKHLLLLISNSDNEKSSVVMLFRGPLLKRTLCLAMLWFAMTISYYGLLLNIGKFNLGNLHVTSMILAAVEVPAIASSVPVLLKGGRRISIFISMIACGLACIASELFSISRNNEWIMIGCLMIGKFSIAMTNMMLPIFTAELYPTLIRNLGVGASQVSSGLALICIPYLWELTVFNAHLPMVTMAALSAVGGTLVLLLPETMGGSKKMVGSDSQPPSDSKIPSTTAPNGTFTITNDRGLSD